MNKITLALSILLVSIFSTSQAAYPNVYKGITPLEVPIGADVGEPLIITPYLENDQIEEARAASLVTIEGFKEIPSYTGFFTVDKAFDSNLFFWFIPSSDYGHDPVLLWLQGGPGASSIYALFQENGPFIVQNGNDLSFREYTWTKNHSVIYIDNPAGTGFSFTNGGYAQNQTKVGEDLYQALVQFFTLFPELQANPFFITGESYAGKYIPSAGYAIYKHNPSAELKINLQGLFIGDGLTDPEHQIVKYGDYLYEIGFIDDATKDIFVKYQNEIVENIKAKEFLKAFDGFDILLNGDFTSPTIFQNATGLSDYFNFVEAERQSDSSYQSYIQTPEVRKAIHVGNKTYNNGQAVEENLREDVMDTVAPWVAELLSHYRILFFNGQLDIIVAYPLTVNLLKNLNFSSAEEYKTAPRNIWHVDDEIAGYSKVAGNLTEVLVRNAGHMVPADQPKWAYDLVYKFVRNIPLK